MLAPVLFAGDVHVQVAFAVTILLLYLIVVVRQQPYNTREANSLDSYMHGSGTRGVEWSVTFSTGFGMRSRRVP